MLSQAVVRSVLGLPLRHADHEMGALIAYADQPGHFTADRLEQATLLADNAAFGLALVAARTTAAHLEVALHERRQIAIAAGMLINRYKLTEATAEELLRRHAAQQHLPLLDLATRMMATGQLPDPRSGASDPVPHSATGSNHPRG